jgi:hypothetical protein
MATDARREAEVRSDNMKKVYEEIVLDRRSNQVCIEAHVSDDSALCRTQEITLWIEDSNGRRLELVMKPDEAAALRRSLMLVMASFNRGVEDADQ